MPPARRPCRSGSLPASTIGRHRDDTVAVSDRSIPKGVEALTTIDLIARSGPLKSELLNFSTKTRYRRVFSNLLSAQGQSPSALDEAQLTHYLDFFVLQHRLTGGETVLEQFVAAHPDLPTEERDMLLGWLDVVEGVFEVVRRDGDAVILKNLIDELTYRVHSNMGPTVFRSLDRRSFVIGRIVPAGGDWLVSGAMCPLARRLRPEVSKIARDLAMEHPEWVFRNPEILARAWDLQRAGRDRFVRFFGSDMVLIPGPELASRMRGYLEFSRRDALAQIRDGKAAEKAASRPLAEFDFPTSLTESGTVAVIDDEVEGLSFFAGFEEIDQAFTNRSLTDQAHYRERLLDYLDDDSVSPLPFRRLAERDAERLSEILGQALRRRNFDWHRDGEKLMRQRKAWFFERPSLPRVLPVRDR